MLKHDLRNYLPTPFTRILEKETVGLIVFNFLYSETTVNISDMCATIKHCLRMGIIKLLLFSKSVGAKCLQHVFFEAKTGDNAFRQKNV